MQLIAYGKRHRSVPRVSIKPFLAMKMLAILLFIACMGAAAKGNGQTITLSLKNASLETAFRQIEQQTIYRFVYTKEQLQNTSPLTLEMSSGNLKSVLQAVFKTQPLTFTIENKYVLVKPLEKTETRISTLLAEIRGRLVNEQNDPVVGATVSLKGTTRFTTSAPDGSFSFSQVTLPVTIIVTGAELESQEVTTTTSAVLIKLKTKVGELDQVIMMAYGKTTKRLNTGNIAKVSAEEIGRQPVTNPLLALQGQVPGLTVTQSSGVNGSAVKVLIRGQNSLLQGSEPYYIIDGVPFSPGNTPINQLSNASGSAGLSPLNMINPADIESIEVLKDADATAIYGSRGANGVILITTKKGKAGKTTVKANTYFGVSKVTRTMDYLNTREYLQMRREGFKNDNVTPTVTNAPDLLLWDTTTYVDLKELLIGGTARMSNAQLSVSGGTGNTQFLVGGGYSRSTTVFPGSLSDQKTSLLVNLNHTPVNQRLQLNLTLNYGTDRNKLNRYDLTGYIASLPPIIKLYDSAGNINFKENGVLYQNTVGANPLALLNTSYTADLQNLNSNLQVTYKLGKQFLLRTNLGYNMVIADEVHVNPSTSIDPNSTQLPFSNFAYQRQRSWIAEPQLEYTTLFKKGKLNMLAGITWQEQVSSGNTIAASRYTSDIFLSSLAGAGMVIATNSYSQYRYSAAFARINYNNRDKYLLNLTGRRDGSSRFGTDQQVSNFGAVGIGWIFGSEKFAQHWKPLSFGKLRISYGITGNDQIGDYKFLDTWTTSSTTYQGIAVLNPTALYNKDYSWEVNRKLEAAVDLGFFEDRIMLSAACFRNTCGNQIVNYTLPLQTGFSSVGRNLDATIRNQGVELQLSTKNILHKSFSWTTGLNLTFWKNQLLDFPGLETSSYATTYLLGKSINARNRYDFLGIDPLTGISTFQDVDRNGVINSVDRIIPISTDPSWYGGLKNSVTWKNFNLDVLFEFKKQIGPNHLFNLASSVPGYSFRNQPRLVLDRWTKEGDRTDIQRFTALATSTTYNNATRFLVSSDIVYSDASFIRCKNLSLSYTIPDRLLGKWKMNTCKFFLQAQNLFTLTPYAGADPENQSLLILPPLRTVAMGFNVSL
jgi:TonB-dependent starch-binding outer membrane protein SusC